VQLISETFEILSVTIWLADENRRSLALGASTSLTVDQGSALLARVGNVEALLQLLRPVTSPIDLDASSGALVESLRQLDPDQFAHGGRRVCVPLVSGGGLIGLITLADRVSGRPFSTEDFDLLTCIANQVAGAFRNLEMSRTLIQNKEMQAFQAMSAFFVHDLRNSASTLSLMLQNLGKHFGNPDFREDCLRSLSKSVAHINELINRLTLLRHELDLHKVETDLNGLISATLTDFTPRDGLSIHQELNLASRVSVDPAQLRKVITNLLLNAHDAVGGHGAVNIGTSQRHDWAVLTLSDTGCGMTPEFLRHSLFRPFHTTKKNGMGIGMFHSKTIIEAHQGRIEVESELGKGTTFRVLLPLSNRHPQL
jgi:putative PEP-CTERM system histidine kinase